MDGYHPPRLFCFETHLTHVQLRGSSVSCHPPDCRLSPRLRLFAHLVERIKGLSRNGLPRQAERDTVLPDDLPLERAGHAGQVKSKILHDVRSLFFRGVVHADRHRSHGHLDLHLLLIVVRRL